MADAYKFTASNGIVQEQEYPTRYHASKSSCQSGQFNGVKFHNVGGNEEDSVSNDRLKQLIANQPVGVAIHSNPRCLMGYHNGIIKASECPCNDVNSTPVNHGVTVVGYGKSDRGDCSMYWLVKNSWGSDWGDRGYFKLCADFEGTKEGTCQINSFVQYPQM